MQHSFNQEYDCIIIGGGFYGCCLALKLSSQGAKVLIIEKAGELLQRASLHNQARVHQGYHYPRSYITATRSRLNYKKFTHDYKDCIDDSFEKVYAIAQQGSKVSARQFVKFCHTIEAPIFKVSAHVKKLFNPDLIEDIFSVEEVAFNATKLKDILKQKLADSAVSVLYKTEAVKVESQPHDAVQLQTVDGDTFTAQAVYNCTYSHINQLLEQSQMPTLPIKYELTEMSLIEPPDALKLMGVTVMDGPYFSIMPYPSKQLHSLSHVRYTPHFSWTEPHHLSTSILNADPQASNYQYMIHDASRYMPVLQDAQYKESLFETKAVLQQHEIDDGRPILYRKNYGMKNFAVIMGGKLDNIYDILAATGAP